MNSHARVMLELAPKEVNILWDLKLTASSSNQAFTRLTRSRARHSATNTPSYQCGPGSLLTSSACSTSLPVHRSSPAINSVGLKNKREIERVIEREGWSEGARESDRFNKTLPFRYESSLIFS